MKVYVYAPTAFIPGAVGEDMSMELPAGSTLGDALKKLEAPAFLRPLPLFTVNHRRARRSHTLQEGDVISFIIPLGGG
jgi:sulfur carrier protein ThiS